MAPPMPLYLCAVLKYMQKRHDTMLHTDPAKSRNCCLYQAFRREWKRGKWWLINSTVFTTSWAL